MTRCNRAEDIPTASGVPVLIDAPPSFCARGVAQPDSVNVDANANDASANRSATPFVFFKPICLSR